MTNREKFERISAVFATLDTVDEADKAEIMEFCEKEIKALDRKNEKARERAGKKKEEGDALKERIFEILGEEPKTVADIMAELGDADITPSKVVARVSAMVRAGKVAKATCKIDGRKLVAYSVAAMANEEEVA